MSKKKAVILGVIIVLILLWLLWKNRNRVAVPAGQAPETYLTINYPMGNIGGSTFLPPSRNCGCDPRASQLLSNAADVLNKKQDEKAKQINDWMIETNNFFQSNFLS